MPLSSSELFQILLTVVGFLAALQLHSIIKKLDLVSSGLVDVKLLVAESYVRKEDYDRTVETIFRRMDEKVNKENCAHCKTAPNDKGF